MIEIGLDTLEKQEYVSTKYFSSPFGEDVGFSVQTLSGYNILGLHREEMQILSPEAVPKRRQEFFLGRISAHEALRQLGVGMCPVLKGEHNEPIWPDGIVGSISHTDGIAIAAVARKEACGGIGIDVEKISPKVSIEIMTRIGLPSEQSWIKQESGKEQIKRLIMLFSAKESVFKAFFPLEKVFLGFFDAELTWNENNQKFEGLLKKNTGGGFYAGYRFEVGCECTQDYVFTYMTLPSIKESIPNLQEESLYYSTVLNAI